MVDAVGTTTYAYNNGGQLWTENGPWDSDTVTNTYVNGLRTALALQQPTGAWTNGFAYDYAGRLTNVTSQAGSHGYQLGGTVSGSPLARIIRFPNGTGIVNDYDPVGRVWSTAMTNSKELKRYEKSPCCHSPFGYNSCGQFFIWVLSGRQR